MGFFGEPSPKKAKTVTIFWDSQGVMYIDFLEKGKMIKGLYYGDLMGRFDVEWKSFHFHHNNATIHNSAAPQPF